jgi:hypothetical protein
LDRLQAEAEQHYADLEQLEQRLTALEEKMSAIAKTTQSEDELFEATAPSRFQPSGRIVAK